MDTLIANRVSAGLGLEETVEGIAPAVQAREDLPVSAALSIHQKALVTVESMVVGRLVADGSDGAAVEALRSQITSLVAK